MILTCPNCSTRYSASASAIGPKGRKVRCASCGHNWFVTAEDGATETKTASDQPAATPAQDTIAPDRASEADAFTERTMVDVEPIRSQRPEVARALRAKRELERIKAQQRRTYGIWGGIVAMLLLTLGAAYVFRVEVVRIWPNTGSAYAAVHVPVNLFGLDFQDVSAARQFKGGDTVLVIHGQITNSTGKPRTIPPIQAVLRDSKTGKVAFTWDVQPEATDIPGHGQVAFGSELRDPPPGELDLSMEFSDKAAPANQIHKDAHVDDSAAAGKEAPHTATPQEPAHSSSNHDEPGGH